MKNSLVIISILGLNACVPNANKDADPTKSKVCNYIMDSENETVCDLTLGSTEIEFNTHFGAANTEKSVETGINSPYAFCYMLKYEGNLTFCFDSAKVWWRTYSNSRFIRTSKGLKIGDGEVLAIQKYGEPTLKFRHQNGCCDIYEYSLQNNIKFSFVVVDGEVTSLSLDKLKN